MKKLILSFIAATCLFGARAQDRTLIACYTFTGTDKETSISVSELMSASGWAGRRVNTDRLPLHGNGVITMRSAADGDTLYMTSFSTLFQEWQNTEEATRVRKSFENIFQLPMPSAPADVSVELFDSRGNVAASLTHRVDPSDILIRPADLNPPVWKYIEQNGSPEECIDVLFVPEGYTADEMLIFDNDVRRAVKSLLSHDPFKKMRRRFNFISVHLPSRDSGVSIPAEGLWKDTAVASHFDTFYSARYLTTLRLKEMAQKLAGVPYEHIIILANTSNYGGGGIYNSYTLTAAHHTKFEPVVVHEFGHSFAGLADEYYYDDQYSQYYHEGVEPWEPNITTMAAFSEKWQDMLGSKGVGLVEGGGYMSKGVWRACEDCRMKTNEAPGFCPVCQRAIERMIRFHVEQL